MNKTNYCTIYIVRHGQSEANVAKLHGLNTKLSPKGQEQAKELSKKLQNIHFDAIFSSPLVRAKETVEFIAKEQKLEILTKEALREREEGIVDGKADHEVAKEFGHMYEMRRQLPYEKWKTMNIAEGYESDESLMSRFITTLREIAIAYPGKTILVGSHVGIMKTFLIHLGYGTHKTLPASSFSNTSSIKIKTDGVDFFLEQTDGIENFTIHNE
jgi:broad specificity phosphatase PhoE